MPWEEAEFLMSLNDEFVPFCKAQVSQKNCSAVRQITGLCNINRYSSEACDLEEVMLHDLTVPLGLELLSKSRNWQRICNAANL